MAYSPGNLPSRALTKVQGDIELTNGAAQAWARLKRAHPGISIATPAGGYRSAAVQDAMHLAGSSCGTKAERERWGLNPNSTVAIAQHPYGTHETGYAVDIVGTVIDSAFLSVALAHGFTRTFGSADPNHFHYDQRTDKHRFDGK